MTSFDKVLYKWTLNNSVNVTDMFKNTKTETVFSSTDKNKIKFYSKKVARKLLNINKNEKVILFISFDLDSPHKGGDILKKSLLIRI